MLLESDVYKATVGLGDPGPPRSPANEVSAATAKHWQATLTTVALATCQYRSLKGLWTTQPRLGHSNGDYDLESLLLTRPTATNAGSIWLVVGSTPRSPVIIVRKSNCNYMWLYGLNWSQVWFWYKLSAQFFTMLFCTSLFVVISSLVFIKISFVIVRFIILADYFRCFEFFFAYFHPHFFFACMLIKTCFEQ